MEPGAMRRYIPPSPKSISRRQAAFLQSGTAKRLRSSSAGARLRSSSAGDSSAGEEAIDEQDHSQDMQAETSCEEAWENPGSFFDLLNWTPKGTQAKKSD